MAYNNPMKIILCFLALITLDVEAHQLLFKLKNKDVAAVSIEKIKTGALSYNRTVLASSVVKTFNVYRGHEREYLGYDLFGLLDAIYGTSWRTQKRITFTAADGNSQISLIADMLKAAKGKKGHLAYAENGKTGFTFVEKDGHKIDPAPLCLVWSNYSAKDKPSLADPLKWPYQLAVIIID